MSLDDFFGRHFNKTFSKEELLATMQQVSSNVSVGAVMRLNMTINVVNPQYYEALDQILFKKLKSGPDAAGKKFLANYFSWRMLLGAAGQLSKRFRDAAFEFDKAYSGVKEESPRWVGGFVFSIAAFLFQYFIVPRCSVTFWTHSEIIPVGQFFRRSIKSVNQA